jgi:8-oxo-dGTP pyrophosphatase MutT (NUDIX family)
VRTAVRILPVDAAGRVLLLLAVDPARLREPFWFTVGGGIDDGEGESEAAIREPFEETGICIAAIDLVGPLLGNTVSVSWDVYGIEQSQTYYAVRVHDAEVTFEHQDHIEAATR